LIELTIGTIDCCFHIIKLSSWTFLLKKCDLVGDLGGDLGGDFGGDFGGDLGDARGRCPGDTRGKPKVNLKTHFNKTEICLFSPYPRVTWLFQVQHKIICLNSRPHDCICSLLLRMHSQSLQVCPVSSRQFSAGLVLARLPCLFKTVFCMPCLCKTALQLGSCFIKTALSHYFPIYLISNIIYSKMSAIQTTSQSILQKSNPIKNLPCHV
jgi:hypothetical protein